MQQVGTKKRHFYKIVVANARDPTNGRHMEVLGSYVPTQEVKDLRLRFSRVKFWLGVGASISPLTARLLGKAGLIPPPPPPLGRRTCGRQQRLLELEEQTDTRRANLIDEWIRFGSKIATSTTPEAEPKTRNRTNLTSDTIVSDEPDTTSEEQGSNAEKRKRRRLSVVRKFII